MDQCKTCDCGTAVNPGEGCDKFCYIDLATQCQKEGWKKVGPADPDDPQSPTVTTYMDLGLNVLDPQGIMPLPSCPETINIGNLCQLAGLFEMVLGAKFIAGEGISIVPDLNGRLVISLTTPE